MIRDHLKLQGKLIFIIAIVIILLYFKVSQMKRNYTDLHFRVRQLEIFIDSLK